MKIERWSSPLAVFVAAAILLVPFSAVQAQVLGVPQNNYARGSPIGVPTRGLFGARQIGTQPPQVSGQGNIRGLGSGMTSGLDQNSGRATAPIYVNPIQSGWPPQRR